MPNTAPSWVNATLYQEVASRRRGLEAQVKLRTSELEEALVGLKVAQAKLVEAERSSSLGLLVAGISHEINNALNFISANLPTVGKYAAAYESLLWFEQMASDMALEPIGFAYRLMTRSGRIDREKLRRRDPAFVAAYENETR